MAIYHGRIRKKVTWKNKSKFIMETEILSEFSDFTEAPVIKKQTW